jgi:hypothetical protein
MAMLNIEHNYGGRKGGLIAIVCGSLLAFIIFSVRN